MEVDGDHKSRIHPQASVQVLLLLWIGGLVPLGPKI